MAGDIQVLPAGDKTNCLNQAPMGILPQREAWCKRLCHDCLISLCKFAFWRWVSAGSSRVGNHLIDRYYEV